MWAIVWRELRAQVRRATVHRTRFVCALVALGALAFVLTVRITAWTPAGPRSVQMDGAQAFGWISRMIGVLTLGIMPLLIADTLSRERREGTLPLLFLTPLRPAAVVVGKGVNALVQAMLVFLSVVPVLAVPLLLGGVTPPQMLSTLGTLGALMLIGLAAGTSASSMGERPGRVLALAYVLETGVVTAGVLFALGMATGFDNARWWLAHPEAWLASLGHLWDHFTLVPRSPMPVFGGRGFPGIWGVGPGAPVPAVVWLLGAAAIVWVPALLVAARAVRRASVSEPPSAEREARRRAWTEARLFLGWFRRIQQRNLARNPLLWLQRRTPGPSMQRLVWFAVTALLWTNVISGIGWLSWGFRAVVFVIPGLLVAGILFQSAGIFRAEREAGSIELLLVTGLTEGQILKSALRASIGTFLPAVALHAFINFALQDYWRLGKFPTLVFPLMTSLCVLPLVGLDHALRDGRYFRGLAWLTAAGLLLPGGLALGWGSAWVWLGAQIGVDEPPVGALTVFSGVQAVVGLIAWRRAGACLVNRTFLGVRPAD